MPGFPAPLLRGLTILALGTTLALTHIAFAAAQPTQVLTKQHEDTIDTTSSFSSAPKPAENCYTDAQLVRGVRGKTVLLRTRECD